MVGVLFVPGEESGVANDRVLDALGQAGPEIAFTQRPQRGRIDEHEERLVKGPDHVLAAGVIDRRLAADAGVNVRLDRGGTLHERHAAHPCRRDKPCQVADHTASQGDQRRGSVDSRVGQGVVDPRDPFEALGSVPGGYNERGRVEPGSPKRVHRRLAVQWSDVLVGNHHRPAALDPFGQPRTEPAEQTRPDEHRIARLNVHLDNTLGRCGTHVPNPELRMLN